MMKSDLREKLIKSMLKNLICKGSIIAFNQGFEIARIRNLALEERFLDLLV